MVFMSDFIWLRRDAVELLHAEQLAEHGGPAGLRDPGLLESALARAPNRAAYEDVDAFDCAAAYAHGIAKNHPFVDGNKRAALMAAATFLALNGWRLEADDASVVEMTLGLAAGEVSEGAYADFLRRTSVKAI